MPAQTKLEKVTRIVPGDGHTLDQLDVKPGDWVGFRHSETDPFILAMAERLVNYTGCGRKESLNEICLKPRYEDNYYTLITRGLSLVLDPNNYLSNLIVPNFLPDEHSRRMWLSGTNYIEYAYSGRKQIVDVLRQIKGFEFYADWLEGNIPTLKVKKGA
jgi:hypothetical protein